MTEDRIEDIGSGGGATETETANVGKAGAGEAEASGAGSADPPITGAGDADPAGEANDGSEDEKKAYSTDAKIYEPRYPFRQSGLVKPCDFDVDDMVDLKVKEHIVVVKVVACEDDGNLGTVQIGSSYVQDDLLLPILCHVAFLSSQVFRVQ